MPVPLRSGVFNLKEISVLRTKLTILGFSLLAATVLACGSGESDTAGPGAQDKAETAKTGGKSIVLEVTGPKSADVTYGIGTDQSQDNGAKLPWKKELTSKEAIIIPTVVAQSKGSGKIACKITVDGKVVKENASSGEFAVVTCTADNL
ncbi:MmpS family protein [Micromonospora sp. NBC_01655]|uniref:MmpS family transport accessory protein n=1 Tax=Micromonospora sp. NBC_01655 TaxID=2975983 RepID=UPI002257C2A0|nr:MmpS family transport accessory protein [Micromonospora sp. NBC_01655]MCX4468976.1 MmpS family protein [Micromonospora sp. NBC_01655]